ncbi:MAG: HAMP domain-containing sensor histidine kinase, partial [Actinomycetota bacterium]
AARLRRLADDLSSLSSAGELGTNDRGAVDLAALLVDVVAHLQPQSAAKDLTLTAHSDPLPSIQGDADRLTQVLTNVVGNAIQYTDAGHIEVRAGSANGVVTISVTDTGRGLAPEDQTRIFERFHRVDQHFADGTGVGLAIAKLIVEAHGGTIGAQSDGLGTGTTITIGLPVTGPVQRDREATPSSG